VIKMSRFIISPSHAKTAQNDDAEGALTAAEAKEFIKKERPIISGQREEEIWKIDYVGAIVKEGRIDDALRATPALGLTIEDVKPKAKDGIAYLVEIGEINTASKAAVAFHVTKRELSAIMKEIKEIEDEHFLRKEEKNTQ